MAAAVDRKRKRKKIKHLDLNKSLPDGLFQSDISYSSSESVNALAELSSIHQSSNGKNNDLCSTQKAGSQSDVAMFSVAIEPSEILIKPSVDRCAYSSSPLSMGTSDVHGEGLVCAAVSTPPVAKAAPRLSIATMFYSGHASNEQSTEMNFESCVSSTGAVSVTYPDSSGSWRQNSIASCNAIKNKANTVQSKPVRQSLYRVPVTTGDRASVVPDNIKMSKFMTGATTHEQKRKRSPSWSRRRRDVEKSQLDHVARNTIDLGTRTGDKCNQPLSIVSQATSVYDLSASCPGKNKPKSSTPTCRQNSAEQGVVEQSKIVAMLKKAHEKSEISKSAPLCQTKSDVPYRGSAVNRGEGEGDSSQPHFCSDEMQSTAPAKVGVTLSLGSRGGSDKSDKVAPGSKNSGCVTRIVAHGHRCSMGGEEEPGLNGFGAEQTNSNEPPRFGAVTPKYPACVVRRLRRSNKIVTAANHKKKSKCDSSLSQTLKKKSEQSKAKNYSEPTKLDVLCGRGGKSNHHEGNICYRRQVEELKSVYLISNKKEKTKISQSLVNKVKNNGGRFLRQDEENGKWYTVSTKEAHKKVSQALRETNTPEARAQKRLKYPTTKED